jgi:hypothetical protein
MKVHVCYTIDLDDETVKLLMRRAETCGIERKTPRETIKFLLAEKGKEAAYYASEHAELPPDEDKD